MKYHGEEHMEWLEKWGPHKPYDEMVQVKSYHDGGLVDISDLWYRVYPGVNPVVSLKTAVDYVFNSAFSTDYPKVFRERSNVHS